jgi:hypothetical protein
MICQCSHGLLYDPVIDDVGHTYNRRDIQKHLKGAVGPCPVDRRPMRPEELRPNRLIAALIEERYPTLRKRMHAAAEAAAELPDAPIEREAATGKVSLHHRSVHLECAAFRSCHLLMVLSCAVAERKQH